MDKLRYGMVGGGPGGNIGMVHRYAALIDNQYELVCGAFSRDPEKSKLLNKALRLPLSRCYPNYKTMFMEERKLPESERMQVVSIVTPNHLHFPVAQAAIEQGFHVICEKPLTCTYEEAKLLADQARNNDLLFCVTYTKVGYPMLKEAQAIIHAGRLGKVKKIFVDYRQGWLATVVENNNKQANWRVDPKQSGPAGALADVGSHAFHLAEYLSGHDIIELCAQMNTMVAGRSIDDDNAILMKFDNGASGVIIATQVATGEEENLSVAVYGELGGIKWHLNQPNYLSLYWPNKPMEILRSGIDNALLSPSTLQSGRIPGGHDEGHIEAFANHYRAFAAAVRDRIAGKKIQESDYDYPVLADGVRGMKLIEAALTSHQKKSWVMIKT